MTTSDNAMEPELADRLGRLASWEPSGADSADAASADAVVAGADRRRRRRRGMGVSIAAVVALVGTIGVVTSLDKQADTVVVADDRPDEQTGFAAWGPGWHVLDTGPVPAMSRVAMEWIGDELLVVGDGQAFTFSPASRQWTERGRVPLFVDEMIATGRLVVAVGNDHSSGESFGSTLDLQTWRWSRPSPIPRHPMLDAFGLRGLVDADLIWNGHRVFDTSHAAIFDPAEDTWSSLALPADGPEYIHLLYGRPALINGAVELVSPGIAPGLRWNDGGTGFTEAPGTPAFLEAEYSIGATAGAMFADRVMVADVDAGSDGTRRTWIYDGQYRPIDPPPVPPSRGCPSLAATSKLAIALPCSAPDAYVFDGEGWTSIGRPPTDVRCCSLGAAAGDALVVWSTSTDTANDPGNAPFVGAAVWVPGGPTPDIGEVPAPIMHTCPLEDLGPVLIEAFGDLGWSSPDGQLDANGVCPTQTWTSSTGLSVTQQPGAPPGLVLWQDAVADVRIGEAAPDGGTALQYVASIRNSPWWATIGDSTGDPTDALDTLFKALIATRDQTGPINLDPRGVAAPTSPGSMDVVNVEGADRGGSIGLTSAGGMAPRSISVAYSTQASTADCPKWGRSGIYLNVTVHPDDRSGTDPETFTPETIETTGGLFGDAAVVCRANRTTFLSFKLTDRVPIKVIDRPREGTVTISLG